MVLKHCFLCGESIQPASDGGHPSDPCSLTLMANADHLEDDPEGQVFFCHLECFRPVARGWLFIGPDPETP